MSFLLDDDQRAIHEAVSAICAKFPTEYWINNDNAHKYPTEFVNALRDAGWLTALIPEEYGGGGASISDAAVILQAISESDAAATWVHGQLYAMGVLLRHGTPEQKQKYLPDIAAGKIRMQSFAITEPDAGTDTTRIRTFARREGDEYVVNGQKIFTSRFQNTDLMLLLVRTTKYTDVAKKTDGMSVLLVDKREAQGTQLVSRQIKTIANHDTNELFFEDLRVPVENRIGEEGKGFRCILSGLNSERILVASGNIGAGLYFIRRASEYATTRNVFGRPIGMNQGVQFPLSQAYARLYAASAVRWDAARLYAAGGQPGFEGNSAKLLSSQALWEAANAAMDTFGGYGASQEYGIERKFREARTTLIAPISNNLVLAYIGHQVLRMPKSY